MITTKWLGLMAAVMIPLLATKAQTPPPDAPPPAQAPALSPNAAEVVRLAEAGTSDDVVLAYIQNSTSTFELSADQILYLRDIGVSSPVITAMLTRDNSLRGRAPAYTYDQKLYPPTAPAPAPATQPVQAPPPEPQPAPAEPVSAPLVPQTPPPVYVSSPPPEVSYFYDDLTPYGTWVQLEGVGWCWQPRVVVINHGWRPYCDSGHWVYTDAGWFWQSDYSWGWAAFHYGRWHLHERCGWVWLPDRVWAPAWVTWRYEGDHCGWAPLPPHADFDLHLGFRFNGVRVAANFDFGLRPDHFTFIAMRDFHDHDFAHHRLPPTEVTRIYNNTTVINNYVVNNNTIVNQGIKPDRVAAATHTPIHKVAIRDVPTGSPPMAATRSSAKGDLMVYRPQLKTPPRPEHIVAQKVDDRHPVIQHAPVVPARPERALVAENRPAPGRGTASVPAVQNQGSTRFPAQSTQPQSSVHTARPAQPSAGPSPNLTSPRTSDQPRSAPLTPQPNRYQPERAQTPVYTPPAGQAPSSRYPTERVQPANPTVQPPANRQYPLHTTAPSETARPNAAAQSPATYYPKGYYQASEAHSLPPANPRPVEPRTQPSVAPRPQQPVETAPRGQATPGQSAPGHGRNDQ
ncbi:MAG TPA: DUF6600 domain-containing protein [Verrucomicrobiae bacterium]|nr:DUF6600 domain-containing protein [Verrucomicrobiae bacterium]